MPRDVRAILSYLAIAIATVAGAALPAVYLWREVASIEAHMESTVGIQSLAITRLINRNPNAWRFEENLLGEVLAYRTVYSRGEAHESLRIVEPHGRIIIDVRPALEFPVITRRGPLYDAGAVVAYIEDRHSLRPTLYQTAAMGVVGLLLGLAIFAVLKWLPLRAVDRALTEARKEARNAQTALNERLVVEGKLAQSRDRLALLLKATPAVIWSSRAEADYARTFVSENVREIFGYTPEDFTADSGFWASRIHPEDRPSVFAQLPREIETNRFAHEYRLRHANGSWRWVRADATVTRDAAGRPEQIFGYWIDITLRKEAELELERTQGLLREALRVKSEFMNNVTHELRTPLNAIIGFGELLRDEVPGPLNAQQARFAADILASGQHLLALVEGILEMSRLDAAGAALKREPVEIGAVIEERAAAHRKAAEARGVTIRVEVAPDTDSAQLDPHALRRILDALLDNAVKFNREGGTVALRARRAGDVLEIAVADTGIGIAKEDLPKLFHPLVQLDAALARTYSGIGLGLTLARRLAALQGGTIRVESEPGAGSTFTLRLPIRADS